MIRCGNCKSTHERAIDVRACYDLARGVTPARGMSAREAQRRVADVAREGDRKRGAYDVRTHGPLELNPWFMLDCERFGTRTAVGQWMMPLRSHGRTALISPAEACGTCDAPAYIRPSVGAVQCPACHAVSTPRGWTEARA